MNIRQEVESAIKAFASSQTPPIPIAYEGVPFVQPSSGNYLEVVFLDPSVTNPTVDGQRIRKRGIFQVTANTPDGKGMKTLDELTEGIVALFPFHRKDLYTTFSVEQTPSTSGAMIDGTFRCAVVRVKYRQEF